MPVLQPDTSQGQDYTSPIEPGTYPARIVSGEAGKSKAGNPKCVVKFEVSVSTDKGVVKRSRTSHLPVTGEGTFGFDSLLRAVKMDSLADAYKDPSVSPKPPFDPSSLNGSELLVVIEPNLYKNEATGQEEKRDQISGYLKA